MNKNILGWTAELDSIWRQHHYFAQGDVGRVLSSNRNLAQIQLATGEFTALIPSIGSQLAAYPVPGDWCVVATPDPGSRTTRIIDVLKRRGCITRKRVGRTTAPQTLASHVDLGLILTTRVEDFNWNRIDRYLSMILSEDVTPIICLTKCDLDPEVEATEAVVRASFPNLLVISLSVKEQIGLSRLSAQLKRAQTSTLLGSSGVGKSTLTNWLLGRERRATQPLRNGMAKGRHTTSNGQMFWTATKGWIVDLPGIRELEPWDAQAGIEENFSAITLLAKQCRFGNCQHVHEKDCAVRRAIEHDLLPPRVFANYQRMLREQEHQNRQENRRASTDGKRRDKSMAKLLRKRLRSKQRIP